MKQKYINAHMRVAHEYAKLSSAKRLQVGCIVVKDNRIISIGYNGMPTGWTNVCETQDNVTKPEVLHAETNAIAKLAGSNESGKDATLFVTHQPCLDCAKIIYQTGIKEVYYDHTYRSIEGIKFLEKCNIKVKKVDD